MIDTPYYDIEISGKINYRPDVVNIPEQCDKCSGFILAGEEVAAGLIYDTTDSTFTVVFRHIKCPRPN